MFRGMVGRNETMFLLKRLCIHIKGEDNNFSVERKCLELVGKPGDAVAPYPRHRLLGNFWGKVLKEISTSILWGTTSRGISCLSTRKQNYRRIWDKVYGTGQVCFVYGQWPTIGQALHLWIEPKDKSYGLYVETIFSSGGNRKWVLRKITHELKRGYKIGISASP